MKYRLKKLKRRTGEPVTVSSDPEGELIELDPSSGKKYALVINVGDLLPREIPEHLQRIRKQLDGFFEDGTLLFIPKRGNEPAVEIYEIDPDGEASR